MKYAIVAMCLLLASCEKRITDGEITGKEHRSEQTILIMMPLTSCSRIGKVTSCHTMLIPMWFHYPERWSIAIKKFDGKEWHQATWWVTQDAFSQAVVGGWFESGEAGSEDEPREHVAKPEGK